MNKATAMNFKEALDNKLRAEKVDIKDSSLCIETLKKCVLGNKLATAYEIIYGLEK